MSKSFITVSNEEELHRDIKKLFRNLNFLDDNDHKIIKFLGQKGLYEDKKVVLVENKE